MFSYHFCYSESDWGGGLGTSPPWIIQCWSFCINLIVLIPLYFVHEILPTFDVKVIF